MHFGNTSLPSWRGSHKRWFALGAGLFVFISFIFTASAAPDFVPGRILIKPKPGLPEEQVRSLVSKHGAVEESRILQIGVRILKVSEECQAQVLSALSHNPNIEFAESDFLRPPEATANDPYFSSEWHLQKIQAPQAWDITTGSSSVIIAILDTGIDATHPDLAGKLVPGWNFYDNNSNTAEVYSHGTAVAGTAAGTSNNGLGVTSVAWGCLLMPIRVSDPNGYGSTSAMANGLTWAADHGARVANISYAVTGSSAVTSAAQYFQSKNGVVTVSSGNDTIFDASAENPYILTIGATDTPDTLASWSNTGNSIDLVAPGVSIITTGGGGIYVAGTGTSFSAPIVAGVAALVISANPALNSTQVQNVLKQSADDLGAVGWDSSFGWGRVNAYKAVLAATAGTPPPTGNVIPPTVAISSPSSGSTLAGTVSISASASDNTGVSKVELYINGSFSMTSTSPTPSFSWNTKTVSNGSYSLQAKAYDLSGNVGVSTMVSVIVSNAPPPDITAPSVQVSSPIDASTLLGSVSINISSSDNVGVVRTECYLDGALMASSSSGSLTLTWDTTTTANGGHTLQGRAYDAAGNLGESAIVAVTVSNAAPPDVIAPTVQINTPANGSTVSGATSISLSSSDNVGVVKVECYLDKVLIASSLSAALTFSWDTTSVTNGSHTIEARAYDAANDIGSTSITITVSNTPSPDTTAPTVQFIAPTEASTLSGTTVIAVSGSDNVGVIKLESYLDGVLLATSSTASLNLSWNTTTAANGPHVIKAIAYDDANNSSSSSVNVSVSNTPPDTIAPTVQITSPAGGAIISKSVKITAGASDNVSVTEVRLYVDGALLATDTASPYTFTWNSSKATKGLHKLQAYAYDAAGNVGQSTIISVSK